MEGISKYIILLLTVFCLFSSGKVVYADSVNDIKEFDNLAGDGKIKVK